MLAIVTDLFQITVMDWGRMVGDGELSSRIGFGRDSIASVVPPSTANIPGRLAITNPRSAGISCARGSATG